MRKESSRLKKETLDKSEPGLAEEVLIRQGNSHCFLNIFYIHCLYRRKDANIKKIILDQISNPEGILGIDNNKITNNTPEQLICLLCHFKHGNFIFIFTRWPLYL